MTNAVVPSATATASRRSPSSGTKTSVPAGASISSPATVNRACPVTTMYSSSWAPAPEPVSSWASINSSPASAE
jgi:hypothetical protein